MRITIILFFLALLATACTPDNLAPAISETPAYIVQVNEEILQEDRVFTDGLTLPAGSLLTTDANGSQLTFQLPDGYRTLVYDKTSEQVVLGKSFGGYSCTCSSSSGSCTVFSAPGAGYGCLQSTCEGSCTGKATGTNDEKLAQHQLVGIVYDDEAQLAFAPSNFVISIDPMFRDRFFKSELVATALSDVYDHIYSDLSEFTPPVEQKNVPADFIPDGYTAIPAYVFGVELAMTIPSDKELLNYLAPTNNTMRNNSEKNFGGVTCTGSNGCTCTQDSIWTPKGRIYYCTGCTTCTMKEK